MDGSLLAAGLWRRFRRSRDDEWEERLVSEVDRVTASGDDQVKLVIPALQTELGRRLELATELMRQKGYRLHMVTPAADLTWTAGYERDRGHA